MTRTGVPGRSGRTARDRFGALGAVIGGVLASGPLPSAFAQLDTAIPSPPLGGATPSGRDLGAAPPVSLTPGGGTLSGGNGFGGAADRTSIGRAASAGTGPAPDFTFTPRIDISEAYDTNPGGGYGSGQGGGGDFITTISPSIAVGGNFPRASVSAYYAPQINIYARDGNRTGIGQNGSAQGQAVLIEDVLFLQASAFASYTPALGGGQPGGYNGFGGFSGTGAAAGTTAANAGGIGGLGPFGANATGISRQNATQVTSFSIGPYYVHRFGDVGTFKAGLSYGYSSSNTGSGNPNFVSADPRLRQLQQASGNSYENSTHEVAQFTTGDVLGRTRGTTLFSLTQYDGNGVSRGAYENFFTQQVGYAIDRQFTVFAEGGYEDISYATAPKTLIQDAIWSGGVQWTPDPDSQITVGYGHKFGFNSVFANGRYAVTARTTVTGAYTVGLGTALQAISDLVGNSTLDPSGGTDPGLGAPAAVTSGVIGVSGNNALYRIREATLGVQTVLDRDTFQATFIDQQEDLIGTSVPGFGSSNTGLSFILGWTRALTPQLSGSLSGSIGSSQQGGQSSSDLTYGFDATLSYTISDTLTTYGRYTFFKRDSGIPGGSYDENVFLVGVSKSF